jgi:hypothetical protein
MKLTNLNLSFVQTGPVGAIMEVVQSLLVQASNTKFSSFADKTLG